jgi:hypothetical protein
MSETPKKLQAIDKLSCKDGMPHDPSIFAFIGSMVGVTVVGGIVGTGARFGIEFEMKSQPQQEHSISSQSTVMDICICQMF